MSKQITTMGRLTQQLERMVRALIHDFFNDEMPMPIVTAVPTEKAYAHYSVAPIWEDSKGNRKHEINISTAYLYRPLEEIVASALHECTHYYTDTVLNVQDTSRNGTYHNKLFKSAAESHGLICTKTPVYGYSDTSSILSDTLLEWVLLHDEFREIELYRATPGLSASGIGSRSADGGAAPTEGTKSNSRRYVCPHCGAIVRATRAVNVICGDCLVQMLES